MRSDFMDLTGKIYGRFKVIEYIGKMCGRTAWKCKCSCGNIRNITGDHLRRGHSKSCGCLKIEKITTHGKARTDIYKLWRGMLDRCYNKKNISWKYYGRKGIKVCDRWHKFENFIEDMGIPKKDESLDRFPNMEGDYEQKNCRWANSTEQALNRKSKVNKNSKFRGVILRPSGKWVARIAIKGKMNYIGTFNSEIEAAEIYLENYYKTHKKFPPEYIPVKLLELNTPCSASKPQTWKMIEANKLKISNKLKKKLGI